MSATTGVQLVVFEVAGEEYALPVEAVREVARGGALLPLREAAGAAVGMLEVARGMVPVVEARERLGLPGAGRGAGPRHVVVVRHGGGVRVGLAVDAVREVVTVEREALLSPPAIFAGRAAAVRALVRLDGERLLILLDADGLLDADALAALAGAEAGDRCENQTGTVEGDS